MTEVEERDEDNIPSSGARTAYTQHLALSMGDARDTWVCAHRAGTRLDARVARLDQVILLLVRTGHQMGPSPEWGHNTVVFRKFGQDYYKVIFVSY